MLTDEMKDKIDRIVEKERRKGTPDDLIRSSVKDMISVYIAKELLNLTNEIDEYLNLKL